MIDSTTVKAHRTAASMACDGKPRKVGRSAGGLTTKIHLLATTDKIPLDFSLTEGQAGDAPEGENLIMNNMTGFKYLLADKAYDRDRIRAEDSARLINRGSHDKKARSCFISCLWHIDPKFVQKKVT